MPEQDDLHIRGRYAAWSEEKRIELSTISPEDAQAAVDEWRKVAPRKYQALVTAGLKGSGLIFDQKRMAYVVKATGRVVPPAAVSQAMRSAVGGWTEQMQRTTRAMMAGKVDLGVWQAEMSAKLKTIHANAMILGKGGVANVTREDALWTQGELKWQNERLQRFALQVRSGEASAATSGLIENRVGMYADAAGGSFEAHRRAMAQDEGFDEERRVLGQAEHCDTCIEEAGAGWQPIGTLREIGDSECMVKCKCHFEYRRTVTETRRPSPAKPEAAAKPAMGEAAVSETRDARDFMASAWPEPEETADLAGSLLREAAGGKVSTSSLKMQLEALGKAREMQRLTQEINAGGATYSLTQHSTLVGKKLVAVAPFPERSEVFDMSGGQKLSASQLAEYLRHNKDMLKKRAYALGGWYDKDGQKVYLDISAALPKGPAVALAKACNQIAAYDLYKAKTDPAHAEIKTGGTGEAKDLPSWDERLRLVEKYFKRGRRK